MIKDNEAEMVISIHANSIGSPRWYGAQTFYYEAHENSKALARFIQEEIKRVLQNTDRNIKTGDYYMLKKQSGSCYYSRSRFFYLILEKGNY